MCQKERTTPEPVNCHHNVGAERNTYIGNDNIGQVLANTIYGIARILATGQERHDYTKKNAQPGSSGRGKEWKFQTVISGSNLSIAERFTTAG
jgi:hypothetical protein